MVNCDSADRIARGAARALFLCCGLSLPASAAAGQTWPADLLSDLPTGANLFAVLETTQAEVVTDRFNSGGLNAGEPSRAGGFLASWRQTRYRLGDVNLSSASDGTPLLFPEIAWWQSVDVATQSFPTDINAAGLAVSMQPRRPAQAWTGRIDGSVSAGDLAGRGRNGPPAIARLQQWTHAGALVSGPVVGDRLGVVLGAAWSRSDISHRGAAHQTGELASAFAHAVFTPRAGDEVRAVAWTQQGARDATHVQSTFERRRGAAGWRIFGAYTQMSRSPEPLASGLVIDRLTQGPVPALVAERDGTERQWSLGGRLAPRAFGRHALVAGADVTRASVRESPAFSGLIGETLDGRPARVWSYASPAADARRHALTLAAFVADRIVWSARLSAELGLRFEQVAGAAAGAVEGVTWRTLLPNASLRWRLGTPLALSLFTGIERSAEPLLLDLLTAGDPASPTADVHRWDSGLDTSGPVISRAGPGSGGDAQFSAIDPQLQRPRTDTFVIGIESTPTAAMTFRVAGVARRHSQRVQIVNAGVPFDTYRPFTVRDANADLARPDDDQDLVVYERAPATFGQDRHVLANPAQAAASMGAVIVSARASTPRLFLSIAATAAAAVGAGASRGFRAAENDLGGLGELFDNPNAATNARGRLFNDRAYTIKWTTVYRFPYDVRMGVIARYQDGQPFSRIVVVPGLYQGAEAVQAFANGRSRFAFTGTLDVRLQKRLRRGTTGIDVILDVYNLPNMRKETEEYVVTGPRFRETTAVQPPRSIHLGLRVVF